jgi:hypothetical protein
MRSREVPTGAHRTVRQPAARTRPQGGVGRTQASRPSRIAQPAALPRHLEPRSNRPPIPGHRDHRRAAHHSGDGNRDGQSLHRRYADARICPRRSSAPSLPTSTSWSPGSSSTPTPPTSGTSRSPLPARRTATTGWSTTTSSPAPRALTPAARCRRTNSPPSTSAGCDGADVVPVEWSANETLDEPDDQVVVHAHLHAFAERTLASAFALRPGHGHAVRSSRWAVPYRLTDRRCGAVHLLALSLAPLGHWPEHMSQSGSDVQRRPATRDCIERRRSRCRISRRRDCSQAVNKPLN